VQAVAQMGKMKIKSHITKFQGMIEHGGGPVYSDAFCFCRHESRARLSCSDLYRVLNLDSSHSAREVGATALIAMIYREN
jgi:hypothetical protein